jgi:hypothetical protein
MPLRIELPEDLIHDLEQEASRRHVLLAEMIREVLQMWRASRETPAHDRELRVEEDVIQCAVGLVNQYPLRTAAILRVYSRRPLASCLLRWINRRFEAGRVPTCQGLGEVRDGMQGDNRCRP